MELGKRVMISVALIFIVVLVEAQGHKFFGGRFGKGRHNHGSNKVSQEQLRQNITALANEQSTEVLIQFLTAMNNTEVLRSLKQLKLEPTVIQQLLTKLKGNPQQVVEAKQAIKDQFAVTKLDQYTKKDWKAVGELLKAYKFYLSKQMVKKTLNEQSTEKLVTGFTALSKQERYRRFRGILFTDLLRKLQYNGEQGRKEVIETLTKWIDTADSKSLKKVIKIYVRATASQQMTTPPPTGLPSTTLNGQPKISPTGPSTTNGQYTSKLFTTTPSGQSTIPPSGQSTLPPSGQSTVPPSGQSTTPSGGQSTVKSGGISTTFRQTTPTPSVTFTGSTTTRPSSSQAPSTTPVRRPE